MLERDRRLSKSTMQKARPEKAHGGMLMMCLRQKSTDANQMQVASMSRFVQCLARAAPIICILHTHAGVSVPRQGLIYGSTMAQSKSHAKAHVGVRRPSGNLG